MRNFVLHSFFYKLYFKIAQTIYSDHRINSVVAIENILKSDENDNICDFAVACKNFSLPTTILDKEFQIVTQGETVPCFSLTVNEYDIVVSLFNLHTQNREEQIHFIRQMRQSASKAIFLEYENPERNIAYLGYLPVILGQYISLYYENRKKSVQNSQLENMKSYLKRGALEGILYELPAILPESSITVLQRKSFGIGGIGMAYLEWD